MPPSVPDLLRRWQTLKAERDQYADLWQEIAERVVPHKSNITKVLSVGERQTKELFDATAIDALQTLAASIHGTLTPSTQPWLSLAIRQEELNELGEVKDWLEDSARRIHAALRNSNWTTAVHEMYLDLVGPAGMGCLFVEEQPPQESGRFGGFKFTAHPAGEYAVAEDADGRVDTLFRTISLTARAIVKKWGLLAGETMRDTAKEKPDKRFTVLQAVMPNDEFVHGGRGRLNGKWYSAYVVIETRKKLGEGKFEEFPFLCPRWAKTAGEVYGRGPSHTALPDIRTVNTVKEFLLKAAPLAMVPPTIEQDDAVIGLPDLRPAGRNVVNASGSRSIQETFAFMQTGLKIDLSQIVLQDLQRQIRRIYFADQLELPEHPQMTATEVQVRFELLQRLLGPTLGRLEAEFLNPLVDRLFGIMARTQALLPPPEVLQERVGEADIDVEYEGPLARAQRTVELTAQDRVLVFVSSVAQALVAGGVPPTEARRIWDVLKLDRWVRDRAAITGVRSDSIASEEEVAEIRQQRDEADAEMQQLAMAGSVAEAAGKAAPAVRALDQLTTPSNGGGRA